MSGNYKIHRNRWYEITLTDETVRIIQGQQSIPAIKKEYKNKIKSIRRISLDKWNETQEEMYGKYTAFMDLEYNTGEEPGQPTEIISIGIVIVDRKHLKKKGTYYSLVRPKVNVVLNSYCKELTHLKQKEIDKARSFPEVMDEVKELYRKWGIRRTYVYGNADRPVLCDNGALNEIQETVTPVTEGMKDAAPELFSILFDKDGCISLEKLGNILDIHMEGEWHNALYDAELLWKCYDAVMKKKIPADRLAAAKDEWIIKDVYMKSRKFDEPKKGFPNRKKDAAQEVIQSLLDSVEAGTLKERGKLLALCDDTLLLIGEKPRYLKEYLTMV